MGKLITLQSGAKLDITMADFEQGEALLVAVTKEIQELNISDKEDHLNILKNVMAKAILSNDIRTALKPCLEKTTYNNVKITNVAEVFQDEKARGDYLIVLKEVLEYNLTPFFANVFLLLRDLGQRVRTFQK